MNTLAELNAAMEGAFSRLSRKHDEFSTRIQELEQKLAAKPGSATASNYKPGELTELVMKSDGFAAFTKGLAPSVQITVPGKLFKTAIVNATLDNNQPLVAPDRRPGIAFAPQRRFTIRDLFPQIPTNSNLVEFTRESSFTSNAGPQYDASSPAVQTEGALKNESGMTFELASAPVITLAHWIPASRQVLADAPALQQHVENRLLYGLKLCEEDELLNGDGTNGKLSGLIANATAFSGGSTNLTALDALALAIGQLTAGNYEPTGIILNPADWYSNRILLAKDSQNRYILGDPANMVEPRLWGLPVVVTNTMPQGEFVVLDAQRTGYISDREDAIVRISESHADFFVRNVLVVLAEERLTLVIQLGAAMVHGNLSFVG